MSETANIRFEFDADINKLTSKVVKVRKRLADLGKTTGIFEKQTKSLTSATDKQTTSTERAGFAAQALGGRLGEMVERVQNASKALGPLGATALLSSVALTSAATAAIALTVAAFAMVKAADAAVESLGDLADISNADKRALDDATNAMDTTAVAGQQLAITIGVELSPAVEELTDLITKSILIFRDFVDSGLGQATLLAAELTLELTGLARSFRILEDVTSSYDDELVELREETERFAEATEEAARQVDALAKSEGRIAELDAEIALSRLEGTALIRERARIARSSADAEIAALEDTADALGALSEERDLIESQISERRLEAQLEEIRLGEELAQALEKERGARESVNDVVEESIELFSKITIAQSEFKDGVSEIIKTEEILKDIVKETSDEFKNQEEVLIGSAGTLEQIAAAAGLISDAFGFVSDQLASVEGAFKATKVAAVALFVASQAAAIGQIAIDTAKATIALAIPPPIGLGPIAGPIFAVATGALAAGKVLAQKPPSFHIGGVVSEDAPRLPGGGPRDRLAIVEPGERVTPEGQGGGMSVRAFIQLGHRTIEQAVMTSLDGGVLEGFDEPEFLGQARFAESR